MLDFNNWKNTRVLQVDVSSRVTTIWFGAHQFLAGWVHILSTSWPHAITYNLPNCDACSEVHVPGWGEDVSPIPFRHPLGLLPVRHSTRDNLPDVHVPGWGEDVSPIPFPHPLGPTLSPLLPWQQVSVVHFPCRVLLSWWWCGPSWGEGWPLVQTLGGWCVSSLLLWWVHVRHSELSSWWRNREPHAFRATQIWRTRAKKTSVVTESSVGIGGAIRKHRSNSTVPSRPTLYFIILYYILLFSRVE